MKLQKFAKLVKQYGTCYIYHLPGGVVWLGTSTGIYRAAGMPETIDSASMAVVLDFDAKQAAKTIMQDRECDSEASMIMVDMREEAPEITAKKISIAAVKNGVMATALLCDDGELVFYDSDLLSPLADVFKESEYVEITVRIGKDGRRYVVVHDGFDVVGAVAPLDIIDKDFIGDLEEFQTLCVSQYFRQQERIAQMVEYGTDDAQMSMDETEAAGDED